MTPPHKDAPLVLDYIMMYFWHPSVQGMYILRYICICNISMYLLDMDVYDRHFGLRHDVLLYMRCTLTNLCMDTTYDDTI